MKKNIISMAVIAAFLASSCQKDNTQDNVVSKQDAIQFTASIESSTDTKTTVERVTDPEVAYKTYWESTDEISINGVKYTATPKSENPTSAIFIKNSGEGSDPTGTYHAYFPASIYNGTTATLPATYTYTAGKYNMPMYAESDNESLDFKGLCAVLAIKVTSSDIAKLKTIKVKSNKAMYGTFTVSDNKAVLDAATDATKAVVLNCPTALTLDSDGTTFYIAIPAQAYSYLEVYLSSDGKTYTKMMCTKAKSGLGTLVRNTVYPIDYETNAIQLWSGGPFWATTNVGASTPEDYGSFLSWPGQSISWGDGWRLPTRDEIRKAFNFSGNTGYCDDPTYTNDKGVTLTGCQTGYTSNSVFWPSAGLSDGSYVGGHGFYWLDAEGGISNAYRLETKTYGTWMQYGAEMTYCDKGYTYSVRLVR